MPAVLEAEETAQLATEISQAERVRPWRFQAGHPAYRRSDGTTGRPKGVKNAITVYEQAAPKLIKTALKLSLHPNKLQGEMLRHSIDKLVPDAGSASPSSILLMSAEDMTAIRTLAASILSVAPSTRMGFVDAESSVVEAPPSTVSASAGTESRQPPTPPVVATLPSL